MSAPTTFQVTGLAVKQVKVTPGSSFEQTMMGLSPRCYIPIFVEIGPSVPEKKIFDRFFRYRGVAAILVMWPASCDKHYVIRLTINTHIYLYIQLDVCSY